MGIEEIAEYVERYVRMRGLTSWRTLLPADHTPPRQAKAEPARIDGTLGAGSGLTLLTSSLFRPQTGPSAAAFSGPRREGAWERVLGQRVDGS